MTNQKFEFGSVAQEIIRAYWTNGVAPTYSEFTKKWLETKQAHPQSHPEWAFLTDRKQGVADKDWKKIRMQNAKAALEILNKRFS